MQEMQDWQARVVAERDELSLKLDKLGAFLASEKIEAISPAGRERLEEQAKAMTRYLSILDDRIRNF